MGRPQRCNALPGWRSNRTDAARLLIEAGAPAAFHRLSARHLAALYEAPVPCPAVTIACFRADEALLTWRNRRDQVWDVSYYALPPGAAVAQYATHLLTDLGAVAPAPLQQIFGLIDWGAAARAAGWGWTGCLFGHVGAITALP